MNRFSNRQWLIKFFIVIAFVGNFFLAILLTIAQIIVDPTILATFGYWLEFVTTLMLGYSSLALSIILAMENTKEYQKENEVNNYDLVKNSVIKLNNDIVICGLSNGLSITVKKDNSLRKLNAYLIKCERRKKSKWFRDIEYWKLEYLTTLQYIKAVDGDDEQCLIDLRRQGFNLESKRAKYNKIKESSLLTGRVSSSDDEELGINTFSYIIDKKLPFLLVGMFVTTILAIITWQLDFSAQGMMELVGKLLLIIWNIVLGYVLGVDIIENYHIGQMNKVRLYLQKFYDKNKEKS
jgi:hypothetical protein